MQSIEIVEAELIEWLEFYDMKRGRYNALLCDPPYALISIAKRFGDPDAAPAQEGADGRFSRLSSGFMGQEWDSFESLEEYRDWIAEWADLLITYALHPGAICLFFGGTRTWHHLAVGLEAGGFEVYDTLMWLYGAGFPKSHNISKYINNDIWNGYGTALKPAWEPILFCRAPREGTTFAKLATEHGSGALNIDGARITSGDTPKKWDSPRGGIWTTDSEAKGELVDQPLGRWPANLLISHHEDCVKIGDYEAPKDTLLPHGKITTRPPGHLAGSEPTEDRVELPKRKVTHYRKKGRVINRWQTGMKPFGDAAGEDYESEQMEVDIIERWACVPECPIRQLDDQAGELTSGLMKAGQPRRASKELGGYQDGFPDEATDRDTYADVGGPSRFFYCGKASRSEKDKGLSHFFWERAKKGYKRIDRDRYEQLPRRKRARANIHPSVKPLDLLRYLAILILPPPQDGRIRRLLIPFSGSGSEIIAAKQAGWDEVLAIEMEPNYNEIARARIAGTLGMF